MSATLMPCTGEQEYVQEGTVATGVREGRHSHGSGARRRTGSELFASIASYLVAKDHLLDVLASADEWQAREKARYGERTIRTSSPFSDIVADGVLLVCSVGVTVRKDVLVT